MSLWHRFTAVLSSEAREELQAAQFVLGPKYVDWVWQQRQIASKPQRRSHMEGWPLTVYCAKPKPKSNVTPISAAKKGEWK